MKNLVLILSVICMASGATVVSIPEAEPPKIPPPATERREGNLH